MAFGSLAQAVVDIGYNLNPLQSGLQRAKGMLSGFSKSAGGILSSGLVNLGLAAGISGIVALSVRNFAKQEEAEIGLASALRATGQEVDGNLSKLKNYASAMQSVTTHGDEALMPVMALGMNLGLNADQAAEATKAAVGLSKALGMNVNEAMKAVAKEMAGQKSSLNEQIPGLMDVADANERMALISKKAAMGMKEEMDAAESSAGGFTQLKNTVGDLTEMLGGLIASAINPMVSWLHNLINVTTTYASESETSLDTVGGAFSSLGSIVSSIASAYAKYVEGMVFNILNLSTYGKILGASMVQGFGTMLDAASWAFGNIVNVGEWLWNNIGILFQDGVSYASTVFSNLGSNIKTFFTGLWSWIKSGGKEGFEEGFKGISEGFKAKTTTLPEYKKWEEGALTKVAREDKERYWKELEANRKKWEETKDKIAEEKQAAREEMSNVNVTLTDAGKKREEEKEKKKESGSGSSFVGLVDVWKQAQEAMLKPKDETAKKQLDETKKQTGVLTEIRDVFKGAALAT